MAAVSWIFPSTSLKPEALLGLSSPHVERTGDLRRTRKSQKSTCPRCSIQIDTAGKKPAAQYEVKYENLGHFSELTGRGQGWTDAEGNLDQRLLARFRALTVQAADRVEMHAILADQRSNWNSLFHSTITIAAVSAATAAAMNGADPVLGLTVVATLLNLACAAFMALVNKHQPSQLAEEQRRAARFFKRLMVEVEATLEIDPDLRVEASVYWKEKVGILHALDKAFPLPLAPNGLEKFPEQVLPSELSAPLIHEDFEIDDDGRAYYKPDSRSNGWTERTEEYLKEIVECLCTSDVPGLIEWAEKAKRVNLAMAKTSPILAVAAAVCCVGDAISGLPAALHVPWLAAVLTVGALFTHSVSHALQLGGGFELYRNVAGYYAEIGQVTKRVLKLPPHMREDWTLFLQKINLQLGHDPSRDTVQSNDHRAGRLF